MALDVGTYQAEILVGERGNGPGIARRPRALRAAGTRVWLRAPLAA